MSKRVAERLKAAGPKRMLALDGGGTRGVITIAFLRRIEAVLQQRLGRDDSFVLADYFDMIGGTSVGSLLATMLALGFRVAEIESRFAQWSPDIFRNRRMKLPHWLQPRFDSDALSEKIRLVVRYEPLRSERLKTGLCVVAKRADTSSVWVLSNNPAGRFWADQGDQVGNGDYQLHDIIRASTAAPTFFRSIEIPIFRGGTMHDAPLKRGRFVDGGVSPHNDPALQMLMMASLAGYNLGGADLRNGEPGKSWPLGVDNLLIVSVGTGAHTIEAKESWPALEAIDALKGVIGDGQELSLAMLQWLGRCSLNWHVDAEMGDVADDAPATGKLFSYVRYDLPLDTGWMLGRNGGVKPGPALRDALDRYGLLEAATLTPALKAMQELIALDEMPRLHALAVAAATDLVQGPHFPAAFDMVWKPAASTRSWGAPMSTDRFPT